MIKKIGAPMIQRSKIDVILRSFWKTSFVTFLREMSGKDWNPIFSIDGLFSPGVFDAMFIFGTSQS